MPMKKKSARNVGLSEAQIRKIVQSAPEAMTEEQLAATPPKVQQTVLKIARLKSRIERLPLGQRKLFDDLLREGWSREEFRAERQLFIVAGRAIKLHRGFPCLFHVTSRKTAEKVITAGFHDGTGDYGFRKDDGAPAEFSGVWLSNRPLDCN